MIISKFKNLKIAIFDELHLKKKIEQTVNYNQSNLAYDFPSFH
jgi:hypothetical protein